MTTPRDFELIHHADDKTRLDGWRQNVGVPVALDVPRHEERQADHRTLVVLSWNLWVGHARLIELVSRIRNGEFTAQGASPDLPLIVLAQEAFRRDESLAIGKSRHSGATAATRRGHQREDIVETAQALGMHLRYAPSMRNGSMQSDRGNAILSTLPFASSTAIELPHVMQRRVAVTATIGAGAHSLCVVSAHLDPRGLPGRRWLGIAGRGEQARHLVNALTSETIVLGADLNVVGGRFEPAWRALQDGGFTMGVPSALPTWRHTFHAMPQLVIDYLLVRDRAGVITRARVQRLDEHAQDRSPLVFGSDHHPLVARVDLSPSRVSNA